MIAIVDYQMGNLRSVQKAFERLGVEATITSDPGALAAATHIVLPGVGAFEDAMAELDRRGLVTPLHELIEGGKPFLGICLGLQLLMEVSTEGGRHAGLGVIPGDVVRFDVPRPHKVPHMGWNIVRYLRRPPIFADIPDASYFYFVHSYYVVPRDSAVTAGETPYLDPFCSVIWRDNLFATQFHPEKSQRVGLQLLKNFAALPSPA